MPDPFGADSPLSLLTLSSVRQYLRRSHAVMMAVFFAAVYALASMIIGSMLILTPLGPPYFFEVVWGGTAPAWNYPGLIIEQWWGVLVLPFFATFAMVVVSIGVGVGMAIAVLLGISLVRNRKARDGRGQPTAVGTVAGLTPAMIALVTLGACCSVTAASVAGVGVVGQVSGTSTSNLLYNNWYLGAFQMVVVWIALFGQELLLRVYGGLFGLPVAGSSSYPVAATPPRASPRVVGSALLRVALLVGGITWSLTMLAAWTTTDPSTASPTLWFDWIVQHQLVSMIAIAAALFPRSFARGLVGRSSALGTRLLRGAAALGAATLLVGVPPPFSAWGAGGLGNQLWALIAGPAAWAASPSALAPGADLYFVWVLQYLLLGGFVLLLALSPRRALEPLTWSAGEVLPTPARDAEGVARPTEPAPTPPSSVGPPDSVGAREPSAPHPRSSDF